jgi:hypothetical protein
MRTQRPKKTVHFRPDTSFARSRPMEHFSRSHPLYFPGKHACSAGSELEDTSFMCDLEYQLLHLKVHSVFRIRDIRQMTTLRRRIKAQENAHVSLMTGLQIQLQDHEFREHVLDKWYAKQIEACDEDISVENHILDEWSKAKAIIIFKGEMGEFVDFQFINNTKEEREAKHYVKDLARTLPVENSGTHRRETICKLNNA